MDDEVVGGVGAVDFGKLEDFGVLFLAVGNAWVAVFCEDDVGVDDGCVYEELFLEGCAGVVAFYVE